MNTSRMRELAKQLAENSAMLLEMADAIEKIEGQMPSQERIADMGFSVRTRNSLISVGIKTVDQLLQRTGEELTLIRNFGETSLREVVAKLMERGLSLKD